MLVEQVLRVNLLRTVMDLNNRIDSGPALPLSRFMSAVRPIKVDDGRPDLPTLPYGVRGT